MLTEGVSIALISTLGGIIATYLTVKYKDRVVEKKRRKLPADRMDNIFDGYEALIKRQQLEINSKSQLVDHLDNLVSRLREDLDKTERLLEETKLELQNTKQQNRNLRDQLNEMKQSYKKR